MTEHQENDTILWSRPNSQLEIMTT